MKQKIILLLGVVLIFPLISLHASEKNDTVKKVEKKEKPPVLNPYHWNVIKFNPTPMLIWGEVRNITLSYERLFAKNHSVSLQLGYLLFPKLFTDTIAQLIELSNRSKYGVNLCVDYRYYPYARNRRPAPDGLYIGAYFSYYGFHFQNDFNILNTTVDQYGGIEGKLNILNLGGMLGYQFVFWKRLTLDLLMFGPSLSYYSGNLTISGNLDPDEIENIDKELVEKLLDRFPFLGTLFSNESLKFTGTRASLSVGFRYCIQLGFHF
jgi:hypothetical protein